MKEAEILKAVLEFCGRHPKVAYCWRNSVGRPVFHGKHYALGEPGSSDIIGFTKQGQFLAIECKAERGRLSKSQENFLDRVKQAGGLCGVAKSVMDAAAILGDLSVPIFDKVTTPADKEKVRQIARKALANGLLTRQTCEQCRVAYLKTEMHHEDYGRPLQVKWLCRSCHRIEHGYRSWTT